MIREIMDELDGYCFVGEDLCIWLVFLSMGEELYLIVIYFIEYWKGLVYRDVEFIFFDIDSNVLVLVKKGFYFKCFV